jgi:hypothetical protein
MQATPEGMALIHVEQPLARPFLHRANQLFPRFEKQIRGDTRASEEDQ